MKRIVIQSQKEMLREDMLIYSLALAGNVLYDWLINIVVGLGLLKLPHEPLGHVYSFGLWQWFISIFCVLQVIRKSRQMRFLA